MEEVICQISREPVDRSRAYRLDSLAEPLIQFIQKTNPGVKPSDYISLDQLNICRRLFLTNLILQENDEVNELEREVLQKISANEILSENIEPEISEKLTFGQKAADQIAKFGGSWTFIGIFFVILAFWMFLNTWLLTKKAFDPFPFILLNLILSCLAAIQAPIIMMSQNRQEQKDRQRSEHDYKINLKAELEIKLLHEKIDHLIVHQNKRLLEIQEIQADFLNDILNITRGNKDDS
ncbi:DUF1003 domain-containing protein [Adhaeribacter soli]|uniref:DUF1003 domain-containing protein n=1 Tax=Adhaeribacter soli TaxID=2607655 RepID=A0A5N1ISW8_9BACT|nr:DUF1003 domain-containing protein [Adhaeribacter soli]KAA9332758.1 DUF1003 domain-containing protein [Adhaeribacter soli]